MRVDASGVATLTNTQAPQRVLTQMITRQAATVPTSPPAELLPLETLDPGFQRIVYQLREKLQERPVRTRRALMNLMSVSPGALKFAWQYAGYMFRSGPWREAIVAFGVDPRTDPKYRIYQTLMFQISVDDPDKDTTQDKTAWVDERTKFRRSMKGKKKDNDSHIFDGKKLSLDGKVFQVCDVTDSILKGLLATSNLRATCDVSDRASCVISPGK